ncbi:MarR family winged helix-turn-helix transcriptional regulator [Paenarthrobacter sp. DKR-5]|uniref:MarR family winged helix-turn-helix transcriptional regulator n=1 Tax=Paenarthrobacter sp. DKR-5 TaxID=2835535 RepID=UPI001BDDA2DE|nr:MarR family winged helix-turn-helix transcriptional regulator [Paenarthrobacter sp. DKR-5]MBT1001877.1 MarR family winged helix-turn-helix transcriptional regulator [Paenarthrobacter sp. DKR-5]
MSVKDETVEELVEEVFRLFRAVKALAVHNAPQSELGMAHVGVLALLSHLGECRATDVAAHLGIGPSALSRQLADLAEQGLIERRPDPADKRATLVSVSETGSSILAAVMKRRTDRLRSMLTEWSEDDAREALRSLSRLTTAFRADQ